MKTLTTLLSTAAILASLPISAKADQPPSASTSACIPLSGTNRCGWSAA